MAEPTLTIQNPTDTDLEIASDDGQTKLSIPKKSSTAVPRRLLLGASFRGHVAAARVAFGAVANEEERTLGIEAMRALLQALAPPILDAARNLPLCKNALAARRLDYNSAWTQANAVVKAGNALQTGAQVLVAGAELFLTPAGAQAAKDAADKALADLDAALLDKVKQSQKLTADELTQYLEDRGAAEKAAAAADAALQVPSAALADEFGGVMTALRAAKDDLGKIRPASLGTSIAAWP